MIFAVTRKVRVKGKHWEEKIRGRGEWCLREDFSWLGGVSNRMGDHLQYWSYFFYMFSKSFFSHYHSFSPVLKRHSKSVHFLNVIQSYIFIVFRWWMTWREWRQTMSRLLIGFKTNTNLLTMMFRYHPMNSMFGSFATQLKHNWMQK